MRRQSGRRNEQETEMFKNDRQSRTRTDGAGIGFVRLLATMIGAGKSPSLYPVGIPQPLVSSPPSVPTPTGSCSTRTRRTRTRRSGRRRIHFGLGFDSLIAPRHNGIWVVPRRRCPLGDAILWQLVDELILNGAVDRMRLHGGGWLGVIIVTWDHTSSSKGNPPPDWRRLWSLYIRT